MRGLKGKRVLVTGGASGIGAGISIRHAFIDITADEWHEVLAVNLTGVFHVAQTAARHMLKQGGGVILNTASTSGHVYVMDGAGTTGGLASQR